MKQKTPMRRTGFKKKGKGLKKIGKIGKQNLEANKILKEMYADKGIITCEANLKGCWKDNGLSFHHKPKRSSAFYRNNPELLHSFKYTLLVCINCHDILENDDWLNGCFFYHRRENNAKS